MSQNLSIDSTSPEDTENIGYRIGKSLNPDDVIALYGELGAGKTCFVKGIARGLGISQAVKSPSFNIINEYPGMVPLIHIDFYRLENKAELDDLGWFEYLDSGAIVAIEWADRVKNMLPSKRIDVYFQILSANNRRLEIITDADSGNRDF